MPTDNSTEITDISHS